MKSPDRVFLDANVLYSAAYRDKSSVAVLWSRPNTVLCSSAYAVEEARRNLDLNEQRRPLEKLVSALSLFEARDTTLPQGLALPPKDVPILLAAISANATHLLTSDMQHFGPLFGKKIAGVLVQLPREYLRSAKSH
jgi:hypothetical protein